MNDTRYTIVGVTILDRLSGLPDDVKTVYYALLLGPHRTSAPGLFRAGPAALAETCEKTQEAFEAHVAVLTERGLVVADFASKVVFLPHAIEDSPPDSGRNVRSWRTVFNEIPLCDAKVSAWRVLRAAASSARDRFEEKAKQDGKKLTTRRWELELGPEPGTDAPPDAPPDAPSGGTSLDATSLERASVPNTNPNQNKNPNPRAIGPSDFFSLSERGRTGDREETRDETVEELTERAKREAREAEERQREPPNEVFERIKREKRERREAEILARFEAPATGGES